MDKDLFAFLKDRKVLTPQGQHTLREFLTEQEKKRENRRRERRVIKKAKCKR